MERVLLLRFGLCNEESCLEIMKLTVLFAVHVICLPITAILLTGSNLIVGDDNVVAKELGDLEPLQIDMAMVTLFKIFERAP